MISKTGKPQFNFLRGGGEMGEIIRGKNWKNTPLGAPETWPQSLKFALTTMLHSAFPCFIFWGKDYVGLYNDAYRPSLGSKGKHPFILGQKGKDAWPENWDVIHPLLQRVWQTEKATYSEDQRIPIERNDTIEDAYWTFSYSPIFDENGDMGGVLTTLIETTQAVDAFQKLSLSEDELKFAIEATDLGTWDVDPINNTLKSNRRLKEWFGLPPEEEIALSQAAEAIIGKDRQRVREAIQQATDARTSGKYDISYTIRNKETGQERFVRAVGRAWINDDNICYRFNGTLQDNTDQRIIEKERLKLISIVENSTEFISLADVHGTIEYVNPNGLQMLAWDTYGDRNILDCIYSEDREEAQKLVPQLFEKGFFSAEIRFHNQQTKKHFWMLWNAFEVKDPKSNEIVALASVSTNIEGQKLKETELQHALAQISKEKEKFRNLVKYAPIGIATFTGKQHIVEMANEASMRVMGAGKKDAVGRPLFKLLPKGNSHLKTLMDSILKTGKTIRQLEFPGVVLIDEKPETLYFNVVFRPLTDEAGKTIGVMVVADNVTESVVLKHILQENEKQFRKLIMQSPIPMAIYAGEELIIELANNTMMNNFMAGKSEGEVIGKSLLDVFPGLKDQKYPRQLLNVIRKGKTYSEKESLVVLEGEKGTQEFYVDYDYIGLSDVDGKVSGIMVTANDVTAQVKAKRKLMEFSKELESEVQKRTTLLASANKKLAASIKKLEATNADLESFAYVSSHDLQQPLRKIQMFTSRIIDRDLENLSEGGQRDFEKISLAASRMRALIEDLLAFSRANTDSPEFERKDLNMMLDEVLENLEDKINTTGTRIETDSLVTLNIIPFQIRQVFQNLIENAIKFSGKDNTPVITIGSEKVRLEKENTLGLVAEKEYVHITVADNGIGFEPQFAEKIFDVFQRLHAKLEYDGTGIGLAIVRKIMQNHNGAISASSAPGKGATFHIYLPL